MSFENPLPPYNASDSQASFLNVSCLDLLLIEMVPLAERMARRAERIGRGELGINGDDEENEGGPSGVEKPRGKGKDWKKGDDGSGVDGEVYRDAVFFRLDGLGYRVGQGLSERYVRLHGPSLERRIAD